MIQLEEHMSEVKSCLYVLVCRHNEVLDQSSLRNQVWTRQAFYFVQHKARKVPFWNSEIIAYFVDWSEGLA